MNKLRRILPIGLLMLVLTGCSIIPSVDKDNLIPDKEALEEKSTENSEENYSKNILLSINYGAAGEGTRAECTDAEIYIYMDGTVKVTMPINEKETELGSFQLDDADMDKLLEIADRDKISDLDIKEDDGCDGSHYSITLYDREGKVLISKGGYMVLGEPFWNMYDSIKEVLSSYDISSMVEAGREKINDFLNGIESEIKDDISHTLQFVTDYGTELEKIVLTNEDIASAVVSVQEDAYGATVYVVSLLFDEEGTEKFAQATLENIGKQISILYDDIVISAPTVINAITEGEAVISGLDSYEEASELAELLNK